MDDKLRELVQRVKASAQVVGDLTVSAATTVGKKAGDVVELSKLNIRIYELKNEIEVMEKEIGHTLYEAHLSPDTDTGEIEELFLSIDQKWEQVAELQEKLTAAKKTRQCPNPACGKTCRKEDTFCPSCGTALD